MSFSNSLGKLSIAALGLSTLLVSVGCGDVTASLDSKTSTAPQATQPQKTVTSKTTLNGTWGSYSWMDDQVGEFLRIKSLGGDSYLGTFYSQGQSGGVFKDFEVNLTDLGDGLAEVTWPSGRSTTATWGKRDSTTPSDMDPSWQGDIWFDCLEETDFAVSRADCNFYLKK